MEGFFRIKAPGDLESKHDLVPVGETVASAGANSAGLFATWKWWQVALLFLAAAGVVGGTAAGLAVGLKTETRPPPPPPSPPSPPATPPPSPPAATYVARSCTGRIGNGPPGYCYSDDPGGGCHGIYNAYNSYQYDYESSLEGVGSVFGSNQDGGTDCTDCIVACCTEACCVGGVQEPGCSHGAFSCAGQINCPVSRRRLQGSLEIVDIDTNSTLATHAAEHARRLAAVSELGKPQNDADGA